MEGESTRPCCMPQAGSQCPGTEHWREDDYGSVGSGGSYEVFVCDTCGHVCRTQLPD